MKRTVTVIVSMLTVVGIVLPSAASAQDRRGFWFSAGGGAGAAAVTCDDCGSDREAGGVGYFRLGGSLTERLLLGVETNLWAKKFAIEQGVDATVNLYNFSGTLTYYPSASGFFIKGGAGAAVADIDVNVEGTTVTVDVGTGFGFIGGLGYDIPVGRRWSVTPGVNFWYGQLGDTRIAGEPFLNNWKQNVIDFTIGITFR